MENLENHNSAIEKTPNRSVISEDFGILNAPKGNRFYQNEKENSDIVDAIKCQLNFDSDSNKNATCDAAYCTPQVCIIYYSYFLNKIIDFIDIFIILIINSIGRAKFSKLCFRCFAWRRTFFFLRIPWGVWHKSTNL